MLAIKKIYKKKQLLQLLLCCAMLLNLLCIVKPMYCSYSDCDVCVNVLLSYM